MPRKQETLNEPSRSGQGQRDIAPDDYPEELRGEFAKLPAQCVKNIGTIAGLTVSSGGYFGLSVTDDSGSLRLAVRHGAFVLDKRYYGLVQFETALAYCLRKLGDTN